MKSRAIDRKITEGRDMHMQTNIAQKHREYNITQQAQNSARLNTEQLRNEIIYAKTINGAHFFHLQKIEEAYQMANDVLTITDPNGPPLHRLSRVIMKAIKSGSYPHNTYSKNVIDLYAGNPYADQSKPVSMMRAFDILTNSTPFVQFAYNAINLAILSQSAHMKRLHIIDIGIGSGYQWSALFAILKGTSFLPNRIRITAIDIPSTESKLIEVGERLSKEANEIGFEFSFTSLIGKAEEVNFEEIKLISGEYLVINAALSLHHTPTDDAITKASHSRESLLSRLRQLNPQLFTLVETDANNNSRQFKDRCLEAFQHYMHVFNALEDYFPRTAKERAILENEFFGREIANILTSEGINRVERHERKEVWADQLQNAGFCYLDNVFARTNRTLKNVIPLPVPFEVFHTPYGLCLYVNNRSLFAASCWRPAP
ncbi:GRAS family protein [Undibacterium sp. Ji67W]|uniref:GRAS family protein n=1 Tax=Undibacterium sp. Ji67W TaxID=3413042 RepID=UPI003BF1778A